MTTSLEPENPLTALRTLRDEIRVRIHLAGMEARERWEKLDHDSEQLLTRAEKVSTRALDDLIGKLRVLSESLKSH
jgi:hypothetical protein